MNNEAMKTALELAIRQNEHDMLMTGDELRKCKAALSQQPAHPTVKESLTVQAQPSCDPVAYRWGWKDAGSSGRFKTYKDKGGWIYRDELPVVAPDMHIEPLYAAQPDYEALRAENEALRARNDDIEPAFAKASKACSSALLALAHTSLDNPLYSDAYDEVNATMPIFMELRKK